MKNQELIDRAEQLILEAGGPWHHTDGVVWREDVIAVSDPRDESGMTPMAELVQEKVADSSAAGAEIIAAMPGLIQELVTALRGDEPEAF